MDSNENLIQNVELQLSELEMLNSMFSNPGELELIDNGVIPDLHDFLSGNLNRDSLPKLEYTINLDILGAKVVINVSLPDLYPDKPAEISVRSGHLRRSNHNGINSDLKEFQETLELGSLNIASVVEWIKDNFQNYMSPVEVAPVSAANPNAKKTNRMWIHSHHIYSKNKIKNIEDWANELNLTGFMLPGKPGFICVEGLETNCSTWWQRIRGMNWQKISCKLEEDDDEKLFKDFKNIAYIRATDGMKAFLDYLKEHKSSHVFKEYFGFDGK